MKKKLTIGSSRFHAVKKALLIMKLSFLLILVGALQVSAKVNGQTEITLKLNQVEISRVLSTIEKQGTYRFLYNSRLKDIHDKIDIDVDRTGIQDVLKKVFTGTDLTYKLLDNNLIVVVSSALTLQDIQVTGKVTGGNGEALSNVSVSVKGTSRGTTTDNAGNFTLTAPETATLVVSYIGYEPQEIKVNSQSVINVKLVQSVKQMDQVVVIGYGSASKRDLTGSIVKVDGKEVQDKPNTNPISSLQSKVTGLSVVNDGTPGSQPDVRIRGTVSIGQVHPLYVVDGIFNDNIDYLNPNDIESIEVLKDPSSLAIFGVKGATGVIAITTKKAKLGQTVINFNTAFGFKKLVDKIKMVNGEQFKELFAEENANNGITTPFDYTGLTANTDWINAVTQTGKYNANNLSISGSTDKNRFNLGLGYTFDEGIVRHEKLDRMLVSFNDEFKVNKAVKIGVNLNVTRQNNPYSAIYRLDDARKAVPLVSDGTKRFHVQDPYGTDSLDLDIYSGLNTALQNSGVVNPVLEIENTWDKRVNIEYRTVGSVYAEFNFLKYFTFRSTWYGDVSNVNDRQYTPLYYAYNPVDNTPYLYSQSTSLTENDVDYKKWQQDQILTFKKSFGDHNITATAGFTTYYFGHFQRQVYVKQGTGANGTPIPDDKRFWYINSGFGVVDPSISQTGGTDGHTYSEQNEYTTASVLARLLYNYKSKYFINGSFRDDASSQIPDKNRHQQFWAVGAAWDISKEDFMNNQHIFDYLKLKGSIGVLGNQSASYLDGTPINYPFYPKLNTGVNAVFGTNIYSAARASYIPNPDLKWETVNAKEIGIELNAFNNRLHFEANYYNKTTENLMTYVSRASLGIDDELINGGSIRNWGEEFAATWNQNINKDFSISIGGNITFLKNKVLSLSADVPNGVLQVTRENNGEAISETKPGQPIAYFKGYVVEGVYQSYTDILKSPNASALGAYRPGDLKFKDVNGDGKITSDDRTFIGNPTPDFMYGGSISVTYKGLTLSCDVGGVYGNEIYRVWGSLESPFQRVNYPAFKLNRWHGPGTSNWDPLLSQADRFNYQGSSYNIEDGSFFRIRNLQLSYSFAKNMISGAKMRDARVFINVQNLKTWKHNSGYTAEFGGNATSFGYDAAGGAIPVVTTFGLNVTF